MSDGEPSYLESSRLNFKERVIQRQLRIKMGERGGLAVFAQGITPFSPSMAAREARLRPCGPASPIDGSAAA